MLHTLRQIVNDDEKWRHILRGLNLTFYHQTVTAEQIEKYMSEQTGLNLEAFFNQYLRDTRIPTLEYAVVNSQLRYRWDNCVRGFNMKLKVYINGQMKWLEPTQRWQNVALDKPFESFEIDPEFYVAEFMITKIE